MVSVAVDHRHPDRYSQHRGVALHPFFSGTAGLTIDQLDVLVGTVRAAGLVTRCGVFQITDQTNPFSWAIGTAWATLLVESGQTDNTVVGQRTVTAGTALTIPANTWFAVGGVEQVAAAVRTVGGNAGQTMSSPLGQSAVGGYAASAGLALYADSDNGAPPATIPPAGATNLDSGVGIHGSV